MYRSTLALALLLLAGCQHMSPDMISYNGKEKLPEFFQNHHSKHENTGLEFRGYNKVTRHFF